MAGAVQHFSSLLGRDDTGVPGSQAGPLQDMELAYEVSEHFGRDGPFTLM